MTKAFFVENYWNNDTLDINSQSWVNDGRCVFKSESEALEAIEHREMVAPEEAGRLSVLSYEVE